MLLRPTLDRFHTIYATTQADIARRDGIAAPLSIPDANRHEPVAALRTLVRAVGIVVRSRPDVILTTGALPGLACLAVGRLLGARTVWLDSLANSERMSISGRFARPFATLWLTQWPAVAEDTGAHYHGSLL